MRLRYTQPALADLEEILDTIAVDSPRVAQRIQARIKAVIDILLSFPKIGARTNDPTIQRMVTRPFSYLIFYEIIDTEIIIHAVGHGARDPSQMPGA